MIKNTLVMRVFVLLVAFFGQILSKFYFYFIEILSRLCMLGGLLLNNHTHMHDLNELDLLIISSIEEHKEFKIKEIDDVEMKYIHGLGVHQLKVGLPIFYDRGALSHFLSTQGNRNKTKRLTPSQTMTIIQHPEIILPNFSRGSANSYLYVGKLETISISIAEVLISENKIRVTHGGFEIKDEDYLIEAKELRNTILEGRQQT